MRSIRFTLITLLAAASACQSYVAVPVQPVTLVAVQQHAKVRVATKADVLLVVDDSFSMSGKQQRLAQALQDFTNQLDALNPPVDYQVSVVTTSVAERFGSCGPANDANAAASCDSDWGATNFTCDTGLACFRAFPQAGKLQSAPPSANGILHRRDYSASAFATYLAQTVTSVGTGGARQPQGMEAMRLALSDPASGFVRDGSKVVVAFFSDAEDCSDPQHRFSALTRDPATGAIVDRCAADANNDGLSPAAIEPVATYVKFLRENLKNADGSAKEIEVSAIVSLKDGTSDPGLCSNPACDAACDSAQGQSACQQRCAQAPTYDICIADCAAECHGFCGGAVAGRRYLELAYAFSGIAANVCSDDASGPLGRLAAVIGIPKQIALRTQPTSEKYLSVHVQRGAQTLTCDQGVGFQLVNSIDGSGPAVQFLGDCILQPDDVWDVRYLANG
jgi:hypothetical protein